MQKAPYPTRDTAAFHRRVQQGRRRDLGVRQSVCAQTDPGPSTNHSGIATSSRFMTQLILHTSVRRTTVDGTGGPWQESRAARRRVGPKRARPCAGQRASPCPAENLADVHSRSDAAVSRSRPVLEFLDFLLPLTNRRHTATDTREQKSSGIAFLGRPVTIYCETYSRFFSPRATVPITARSRQ